MALAHINPKMIVWARTRANLTPDQAAQRFISLEKLTAWERGTQIPTFTQAEALARKFRVPLLALFLSEPPTTDLALPDLRTIKNVGRRKLSTDLREVIADSIVRQDWYREEFPNSKPRFLARQFSIDDDFSAVAEYLRRTLRINDDLLRECTNWKDYLVRLVKSAEDAGVLVSRSGIVRNDGKRKLDVEEFRGFALTDDVAPLVFINSNDTTTAQIFTLIHELAHVCVNEGGISNPDPTRAIKDLRNKTELFCNQVAAEVLIPKQKFIRAWQSKYSNAENLKRVGRYFRVSNMVALRRAYDLGKLESSYFFQAVKDDYDRFKKKQEKDEDKNTATGGPELFVMFAIRSSRRFAKSVFDALYGGRVAHTEAARLLGLKVATLEAFSKRRAA